ncbi:hypothetical protein HL666_20075 [Bradyrhizobium sp. 83002]|uniref:hypothetical protein n=1 Tax=Bradyrhizobium aeschynomenes TaxID=2734909 RepID=UPI001555206C|nr:hypothetical protein [Bradyrhizobium aeschynomenes]NPU13071.1 hypothetical protein [Bradyrhizobium aeschynomenes]
MQIRRAAAISALFGGICSCHIAKAQSANDIINIFGGMVQAAIGQAIQAEWKKLPLDEVSCIDRNLRDRGSSLGALIQQNIGPGDVRLGDIRSGCRRANVQQQPVLPGPLPAPDLREPGPARVREKVVTTGYSVDNLVLGEKISQESAVYKEYQCGPSQQFTELTRCQRRVPEKIQRGSFVSTYSLLHSGDGTLSYVNRFLEPAWFAANEASEDIARIARKYGAQPTLIPMPQKASPLQGMIATWGTVKLELVSADDAAQLALGLSVRLGSMVDFLGNFRRSAHQGLPVYRVVGGMGFVWAANWDQNGRGTLRFFAIDADVLSAKAAPSPSSSPVISSSEASSPPPQLPNPTLSGVTEPDKSDDSLNGGRR